MPVVDKSIGPDSGVAREIVLLFVDDVPISQTGQIYDAAVPGFPFYVEKIEHYVEALTAAVTFIAYIGTTALTGAETPVVETVTAGTITAAVADRKGAATDNLNIKVTSDGSGVATGLKVRVTIRPFPMGGEL